MTGTATGFVSTLTTPAPPVPPTVRRWYGHPRIPLSGLGFIHYGVGGWTQD
jgi:hypothetical protein